MAQVPAERRIKTADMYRLIFHFFNVLNLTLGIVVFGVAVSLLSTSSLPIHLEHSNYVALIYWLFLISSLLSISLGGIGIHSCYWVKSSGLKCYIGTVIAALAAEITIGVLTAVSRDRLVTSFRSSVYEFQNGTSAINRTSVHELNRTLNGSVQWEPEERISYIRLMVYGENRTYRRLVDQVHDTMSCCSFALLKNHRAHYGAVNVSTVDTCFASPYARIALDPLRPCPEAFRNFVAVKMLYIKLLAFLQVPIQLFCLCFDVLVLTTSQVTRDYEKLEREKSIVRRKRHTRHRSSVELGRYEAEDGATPTSHFPNSISSPMFNLKKNLLSSPRAFRPRSSSPGDRGKADTGKKNDDGEGKCAGLQHLGEAVKSASPLSWKRPFSSPKLRK